MDRQRIRELKRPRQPRAAEPTVSITAGQALDRGWWSAICRMKGICEWAVNEGRMSDSDTIELTESEYRQLPRR